MVDRLAEDHANARKLAEGLAEVEGISIDPDALPTNLVFFEVEREDRAETTRQAGRARHKGRRRRTPLALRNPLRHHRVGHRLHAGDGARRVWRGLSPSL